MRGIILTEIDLSGYDFGEIKVERINTKTISRFEGNKDVISIVGCRATANKILNMDFPSLKLYQLTSAGFDTIPVNKFSEKGIWLCNAGDVYSTPIAETVVYGILKYVKRFWKSPKKNFLRPMRGYKYIDELAGKKILIMGCGRIGTAVAKRIVAFDADVCGYDRFPVNKPEYSDIYTSREQLIKNISKFDYIVTTIPLLENTRGFMDAELFSAMKCSAIIVNVARQAIFNDSDLYRALKNKTIGGAVLDMFEKIPNPITNKYRRLSNVLVLPGVSAISIPVKQRLVGHVAKNLNLLINGEQPLFCVN